MLKFLVIALIAFIFASPIFSRLPNHKHTKKIIIEGTYHMHGRSFREKCISVSSAVGIDVDFEKHESLYETYNDCASEVGDYEQFYVDVIEMFTNVRKVYTGSVLYLSDKQKAGIVAFLQTYCPKVINYVKCDDVLSPIYEQCYTVAERNKTAVGKASFLQLFEKFCENNVEQWVKVINTNGFECGLSKGCSCWRDYRVFHDSDPFSNPSTRNVCRFYNMTMNCMSPAFKECELSQTPDTLMRSLFTDIQSDTICNDFLLKIKTPTPPSWLLKKMYLLATNTTRVKVEPVHEK